MILVSCAVQVILGFIAECGHSSQMNLEGQQLCNILAKMENWFWAIPASLEERNHVGHSHLTRSLLPQLHKVGFRIFLLQACVASGHHILQSNLLKCLVQCFHS
jgi:hypothetical protein